MPILIKTAFKHFNRIYFCSVFEKVPDQVTRQVAVRVCKGDKEDVEGDFEIVSSSPISGVRNGVEVDESAGNDDNNNNDDPEKIVFG